MIQVVLYLIGFLIFVFLQSLAINGIHESFKGGCLPGKDVNGKEVCQGMIFWPIKKWLEKRVSDWWQKPLYSCVKCMASVYGFFTYWSIVIPVFGFHPIEVVVFIWDIFILVVINGLLYKKL